LRIQNGFAITDPDVVDETVIQEMAGMGYPTKDLESMLKDRRDSESTAVYKMLKKRQIMETWKNWPILQQNGLIRGASSMEAFERMRRPAVPVQIRPSIGMKKDFVKPMGLRGPMSRCLGMRRETMRMVKGLDAAINKHGSW
jgi:hypothetical protein